MSTKPKPILLESREEYTVAIVCALPHEATAVQAAFDYPVRPDEEVDIAAGDNNAYSFGTLGKYHVVLAILGEMGNNEAADVAANMRRSFPNIRLCLLVGICGIVPQITVQKRPHEALLGDVVISTVVVQYDLGKEFPTGFKATEMFTKASPGLQRAFKQLETPSRLRFLRERLDNHLVELDKHDDMEAYHYPGAALDYLYRSTYVHEHRNTTCSDCDSDMYCKTAVDSNCQDLSCSQTELVSRKRIEALGAICREVLQPTEDGICLKDLSPEATAAVMPKVYLGPVASGNKVMKDGRMRDKVVQEQKVHGQKLIAFEMEGAGVWNNFPTVVIKSGCDYADSHKNKIWQNYAAMTAAACAKAFLDNIQMGMEKNVFFPSEGTSSTARSLGSSQSGAQGNGAHLQAANSGQGVTNNFSGTFSGGRINAGNVYNTQGNANFG